MVRECLLRLVAVAGLAPLTACSLVLDFSDDALPVDAMPELPYTQAQCDYKEPNNSLAEAQPIDPSEMGSAAICASDPEDRDFYVFEVPEATASVTVNISFTNRPSGDLDLKLLDSSGVTVAQSRGFSDGESITCPSATCGMLAADTYYIEVFPALVGAINAYDIALTITPE